MPATAAAALRRAVGAGRRLVVKVGSSSLTSADGGRLDLEALGALVDVLAGRRAAGLQVVLVSSGAIAAGIGPLGLDRRPTDLATQQAAASVGQGALVAAYQAAFSRHGLTVGQVLLTADDTTRRSHYTNARRTLERLLELGIVPIVNENDTVATQEIRFGDNDRLAAVVADLVGADGLVLLTDVDSLYDGPPSKGGSQRVPLVATDADLEAVTIGGTGSAVGSGGMVTKVEAAGIAGAAGIPTLLTRLADVAAGLEGADVGTVFAPAAATRASRKRWLAHATSAKGRLVIDDGAVTAVTERRTSLLPAGVTEVVGSFAAGDPVDVCATDGRVIARGLVTYASTELPRLLGRSTRDLARELGPGYEREVVHRDDLVVL
ncbi:glutamate 5-kinase [Phycicoccus sp. MAQZ13P-2]|uniref:glutamate 5-kinase n=1 Tax=Phycicoccus mangrovi TaxID=2840470 RepID=UPI001C004F64|nr:glutamate 5-kinase [Phycicoccus mangrovi]MBT9257866.1 glutamate 5-kinase [Phycicoccus mangrovi]MBT9272869.1 glutamate 5-kinase [Phycicoccus mangrovi]